MPARPRTAVNLSICMRPRGAATSARAPCIRIPKTPIANKLAPLQAIVARVQMTITYVPGLKERPLHTIFSPKIFLYSFCNLYVWKRDCERGNLIFQSPTYIRFATWSSTIFRATNKKYPIVAIRCLRRKKVSTDKKKIDIRIYHDHLFLYRIKHKCNKT